MVSESKIRPRSIWRAGGPPGERGSGVAEFLLLSALMLFWEICLIRWISTEIRLFAYYKNLSLLSAFLGFGLGLLTSARQTKWLRACVLRLTLLIVVVVVYPLSPARVENAPAFFQEFTWHPSFGSLGVTLKFYAVILLIFVLNAAAFVPWGRRIGFYFDRMKPIPAYSLNVLANLAGIGLFSGLSAAGAPPMVWVGIGLAPLLLLALRSPRREPAVIAGVVLALILTAVQYSVEKGTTYWSPYYKITIVPPASGPEGKPFHTLKVNHDYHQRILDLRPQAIQAHPKVLGPWSLSYGLPYQVGTAGRVLVIGSGTGNDVATALRNKARHVTAVEIDPTLVEIGKRLHPERPYDAETVRVMVSDARTYLANPPEGARFDLIVFGLLDSHTQVSGMTSLRLDNFVYTLESFSQARNLLDPDHGLLAVSFSSAWGKSNWTVRRIHRMLEDVFGTPPKMAYTGYDAGITFLSGPAAAEHPYFATELFRWMNGVARTRVEEGKARVEPPATDDWPFLYLKFRAIPLEYWIMIALVAILSAGWVVFASRGGRDENAGGFSLHFFFLGGAFLLIEVKNLIAFSLLFGSTWQVNNLAIGGVLVMILAANLVAARVRNLNPFALYAALFAVLLLGCVITPEHFQGLGRMAQTIAVPLFLSVPIFCAGLVFIRSFARTAHPAGALGANIIGGICGGLLENASLALGFASLQYFAIGLYALSFLSMLREDRSRRKK